jgi:hypothetical protein
MVKPLADGDFAVTLFNESTTDAATMSATASQLGLPSAASYTIKDLWSGAKQTSSTGAISATVDPTATVMYRVTPVHPLKSSVSGSHPSAAPSSATTTGAIAPKSDQSAQSSHKKSVATTIPANLVSVSCEVKDQCTGVDNFGAEVTFSTSGRQASSKVEIAPSQSLVSVSCPDGLCTAIDRSGTAFTFDTNRGSRLDLHRLVIDPSGEPTAITCVSTKQCTVVDGKGAEVTINPSNDRAGRLDQVDPYTYLAAVSCSSATQCTAAGGGGNNGDTEVTFNPTTGAVGSAGITSLDANTVNGVSSVSCPSTTLCVVVDGAGNEVTFDPATGTPTDTSPAPLEGADLAAGLGVFTSVSCSSPTDCTAVDLSGVAVTFDPSTGAVATDGEQSLDPNGSGLESVSCWGAGCTAVDLGGREVTFEATNTGSRTQVTLVDPPIRWAPTLAL